MTGVTKAETVSGPIAYCAGCDWLRDAPGGEDHPAAYYHRAASQHTRDTGHTTEVVIEQLTRYKQGETQ